MAAFSASPEYSKVIPSTVTHTWSLAGAVSGDMFDGVELSGNADRSVQFVGTVTATIVVQGSNDNTNWETLTDGLGNNLSFTAAGLKQICELTRYIRPAVISGTAGSGCKCLIVTRR